MYVADVSVNLRNLTLLKSNNILNVRMSLVSTPSLINGSIHNQQHGSLSSSADQKGDHGLSEGSVAQSGLGTEAEHFMNQHISTNSNNLAEVGENGDAAGGEDPPVVDIIINNVVCTFSTRCYLNLKKIAMEGTHVEYRRENGVSVSCHLIILLSHLTSVTAQHRKFIYSEC